MISICLLTKWENKYLKEWVEHHLSIGIDHFYIYDNNEIETVDKTLKDFDQSLFTIVPWHDYKIMQLDAYNDCLDKYGKDNEWIAFIDTDEFIDCENIKQILCNYIDCDFIKIRWKMFNANGQIYYNAKPVQERFTQTIPWENKIDFYKSIVQPSKVKHMLVHDAISTGGKIAFADEIMLNHYYTRSLEEWTEKIYRGTCLPWCRRKYNEFFKLNPDLESFRDYFNATEQQYYIKEKKT